MINDWVNIIKENREKILEVFKVARDKSYSSYDSNSYRRDVKISANGEVWYTYPLKENEWSPSSQVGESLVIGSVFQWTLKPHLEEDDRFKVIVSRHDLLGGCSHSDINEFMEVEYYEDYLELKRRELNRFEINVNEVLERRILSLQETVDRGIS